MKTVAFSTAISMQWTAEALAYGAQNIQLSVCASLQYTPGAAQL